MKQVQTQKMASGPCAVTDILEKPKVASGFKACPGGKAPSITPCGMALQEAKKVRGLSPRIVIEKTLKILGRPVKLSKTDEQDKTTAKKITDQLQICHGWGIEILPVSVRQYQDEPPVANSGIILVHAFVSFAKSHYLPRISEKFGIGGNFTKLALQAGKKTKFQVKSRRSFFYRHAGDVKI